ncbi:hypothetical protein IFM89_035009 [Coptis chinensis]|uniref:Cytochrome P450 n=1 Tax=Coptis chinensis TaxID=261450 RepID=A0A835ISP0_9MAGN|nr:hypothetical protein IFM89_035009 [Coptis chinensis]
MPGKRRDNFVITKLVERRKKEMEEGKRYREDVISSFLNLKDEEDQSLTKDEMIDNIVSMIIASHDTSAIVLSLLLRHLARDTYVYEAVLEEQTEISKTKEGKDGMLRWSDVQKMKYTWRVAQELMRVTPPVFGNFKRTTKDTSFGGFDITKGWQDKIVTDSRLVDRGNILMQWTNVHLIQGDNTAPPSRDL